MLQDGLNEHRIHLRHGAVVPAKILERSPKMIEFLAIENQKAVVELAGMHDLKRRVLLVELRNGRLGYRRPNLKSQIATSNFHTHISTTGT